jgi:hypothetical protein
MRKQVRIRFMLFLTVLSGAVWFAWLRADNPAPQREPTQPDTVKVDTPAAPWATALQPKPLSEPVQRGLAFLVSQQHANGGWSQGEEAAQMGNTANMIKDTPNVADTCMATLAFLRAGHTPKEGVYAKNIAKAMEYLCSQIEKTNQDSLYVTEVRGTRLQGKLGPYVDTFLAALVLAEMKGRMPEEKSEQRLLAALNKTVAKIERHQRDNGTWANESGWAPILCQALACKGLNRARQAGIPVADRTLERAEKYAASNFDAKSRQFKTDGSANVALYAGTGNTVALGEAVNTFKQVEGHLRTVADSPSAKPEDRQAAQVQLRKGGETEKAQQAAADALVRRLDDKQFLQGFGSNGGEEFLSYLNISETLLLKGGKEWDAWDKSVTENLNRIQNQDGSWSGHHCITGRTFCTSAALLVVMADRAPVPVAAKMKDMKK